MKAPEDDDLKDRNKFPRDFQDCLDDYSRAYDDWLTAKHEIDANLIVWKEKQKKFDKLAKEFPANLVTVVDVNYLKNMVRRARQNRAKREKTAAAMVAKLQEEQLSVAEKEQEDEKDGDDKPASETIYFPGLGTFFQTIEWKESNFDS